MSDSHRGDVKVLLQGRPGVGKTTCLRRTVELLQETGVEVVGFWTEEITENGRRVGFAVETTDGSRGRLAHVDLPGPPRVGKYGVDLEEFERVALPSIEKAPDRALVAIDEIGKMELASTRFREALAQLFDSPRRVVATVHGYRHPVSDALKGRRDVEVLQVTPGTREMLPVQVVEALVGRES